MVGGNDQSALRGYILNAVEFDVPEQSTEKPNDGPEDLKRPLRKLTSARRRSCGLFLNRICSVTDSSDSSSRFDRFSLSYNGHSLSMNST